MGLKQRLVAKILIEDGRAVKYKQFVNGRRIAGDPVSTVRMLESQNVCEFHFCFLGRYDLDLLARMQDQIFCPTSVAGGIKSVEDACEVIRAGAEKVVVKDPVLVNRIADKYGRSTVCWAQDYHGDAPYFDAPEGAGEILLTSIDRDGMGTGYDLGAARFPYTQPVLLAGGCGKLAHVKDAFEAGASGVAVSSMFAFTDKSPVKLRSWLRSERCNVRA